MWRSELSCTHSLFASTKSYWEAGLYKLWCSTGVDLQVRSRCGRVSWEELLHCPLRNLLLWPHQLHQNMGQVAGWAGCLRPTLSPRASLLMPGLLASPDCYLLDLLPPPAWGCKGWPCQRGCSLVAVPAILVIGLHEDVGLGCSWLEGTVCSLLWQ